MGELPERPSRAPGQLDLQVSSVPRRIGKRYFSEALGVQLNQVPWVTGNRHHGAGGTGLLGGPFNSLEHAVAPIIHVVAGERAARAANQAVEVHPLVWMKSHVKD